MDLKSKESADINTDGPYPFEISDQSNEEIALEKMDSIYVHPEYPEETLVNSRSSGYDR
jgi:hypothetical protein